MLKVHYKCPNCSFDWSEIYECACDDTCPQCETKDIQALSYDPVTNYVDLSKFAESPELLNLDDEVAKLNDYCLERCNSTIFPIESKVIEKHTCDLITLILNKLKEMQDNES